MKNTILKLYILTFFLFSDFVMFAQGDEDAGNEFEDGGTVEDPAAPINSQIIWLLLSGIVFAFVYFRQLQKQHKA